MKAREARGVEDAGHARRRARLGQPETFFATWHIASSGFETTIMIASGDCATTCSVTEPTIFSFVVHEVVAAHARASAAARR